MTSAVPSALTRSSSAAICSPVALIELAGRLVGEQQPRAVGERARDRHALHLAAGELRRPMVGACGQADVLEQLARALLRASALPTPASDCGSSTFSEAVSIGSRKNRWNTKPMCRRRSRLRARVRQRRDVLVRRTAACRTDGVSTQPSMCSSVDLPQPDGPRIAMCSPARDAQRHVRARR